MQERQAIPKLVMILKIIMTLRQILRWRKLRKRRRRPSLKHLPKYSQKKSAKLRVSIKVCIGLN